jgi:hypothetical protein
VGWLMSMLPSKNTFGKNSLQNCGGAFLQSIKRAANVFLLEFCLRLLLEVWLWLFLDDGDKPSVYAHLILVDELVLAL